MSDDLERTADGRYVVVDGRRSRASDTDIPESLRAELVAELTRARHKVDNHGDASQQMVDDAQIALGERGEVWWKEPSEEGRRTRLAATVRALLRHRNGTTICPSDAARVVGGALWRDIMPVVRDVAHDLAQHRLVVVQQKGERVEVHQARGAVRIAPGPELHR